MTQLTEEMYAIFDRDEFSFKKLKSQYSEDELAQIKTDFKDIIDEHNNKNQAVTMICSAKKFTIPYGIIELDENEHITNMKEKPALSFLTNTGCYVVDSSVFKYIDDNENIGFPDVIARMKNDNKTVGIYPIHEDAWLDMGQFDELNRMERELK